MVRVLINDQAEDLPPSSTLVDVLTCLDLHEATIAIAVNGAFVPRSTYGEHALQDGDRIELVAPMAGG